MNNILVESNEPVYFEKNIQVCNQNPISNTSVTRKSNVNYIYDRSTSNKTFINTCNQLKMLGIKRHDFPLILFNKRLVGVDPHDEKNLTPQQVIDITNECKINIFYYLREVVKVQSESGEPVRFILDRASLASAYCFINDINFYLMKPRQTGKTVTICILLSWSYKFGVTNGEFMFSGIDDLGVKNLKTMKTILSLLPSYLSESGLTKISNSKTIRKTDNVKTYSEPGSNNTAKVVLAPNSLLRAERFNRGRTQVYQYIDEAEFFKYIDVAIGVSGMSFNTAAKNARMRGGHACRIFSTTPGDLGDKIACQSALKLVNSAVSWEEKFYDMDIVELKKLIRKASVNNRLMYIRYTYQRLGYGEKWFTEACAAVHGDIMRIRKEILIERFEGVNKSPFTDEDIMELTENCKKPLRTEKIGRGGLYEFYIYEEPKPQRLYFLSIDPSDGTGGDNYAFILFDPYEMSVVMEFKNAYLTIDGCVDLVDWLVKKYSLNVMIIIEKNRNGGGVIERFVNRGYGSRLYASPEASIEKSLTTDKLDEKGFIMEELERRKYYGVSTNLSSRPLMINLVLDTVRFSKKLVNTKLLIDDIKTLIVYPGRYNDKIAAAPGEHDDIVMAWAMCLYVFYYGKNLGKWGFVKGTLPTDIKINTEYEKLKKLYNDPSIKSMFPNFYNFYKTYTEPKLKNEYMQEIEKQKHSISEVKIGGIDFGNDIIEDTSNTNQTKENLLNKWYNMNK